MGTWTRQQKANHGRAKCHHTVRREIVPWGSGHLESQRSFHLQQSWPHPLPTAPLPSMRSGVVTAPRGPWTGDPRPSLPSGQSAAP